MSGQELAKLLLLLVASGRMSGLVGPDVRLLEILQRCTDAAVGAGYPGQGRMSDRCRISAVSFVVLHRPCTWGLGLHSERL
jgi:hypothetical protein